MGGGMMATTDWTPVLIVLGLGLIGGALLALRFARGAPARAAGAAGTTKQKAAPARRIPAALDLELRDLAARRDALLARLADLEATAPGVVGPARVARERWDLELETARVLRDLAAAEAKAGTPAPAPVPAEPPGALAPARWKGLAYAIGGAAFFLAAILAVRQFSTAKTGMGGMGMGAAPAPAPEVTAEDAHGGEAPPNPRIDALKAEVAAHPDDLAVRLDLAEAYLGDARLFEAFEAASPVLAKQPENPRALTYVAVVKLAMGQGAEAEKMLDTAVARDPKLAEALSYRGLVRFQAGRFADAVKDWEAALAVRPDGREALEPLIAQAKARAAGGAAPAEAEAAAPVPRAPAPAAAPAAGAMPAAPADAKLAGRIELSPALAGKVAPGGTLFVIVRPDGMVAGPPVAVSRIDAPTFPTSFALGAQNSMTGAPLPDKVNLEVRLDADGNAMTKDPADPIVRKSGVATGTKDLALVLERP
jgi:cytochrome c-type biogenesis protein CcmH